jgi:predicted GNAT family acetyltransferase
MNEYFIKKDKYLCLFYDNPKAGNIYKRLGFKDVDKWVMLSKE